MRSNKRQWIYEGLSLPPGVAVARPRRPGAAAQRVLLAGGILAEGLGAPLRALARDGHIPLMVDARPDTAPRDWCRWLPKRLSEGQPNVVLLALEPDGAAPQLERVVVRAGARPVWLPRRGRPDRHQLPAEALHIRLQGDRMTPTAAGFAAWAGHCWRMIR